MQRRTVRWAGVLPLPWVVVLVSTAGALHAQEFREFDVDPTGTRRVTFTSRTEVNSFEGVTDRIDGYVVLPNAPLSAGMTTAGSELYFEVDLASLDTGIGLRNRHMRDDYLQVDKFPYAKYKGRLDSVTAGGGGGFRVTATGTMSIHGVDRPMTLPCDVDSAGRGYRVRCTFHLLLSDFDIEIPRLMFLKLANQIDLKVGFSVKPAENTETRPTT